MRSSQPRLCVSQTNSKKNQAKLNTSSACGAAIVKTNIQTHVLSNHDSYRNDTYSIWNIVELCVGILAASLPALRPLFRSILETTKTYGGSRRTTNGVTGLEIGSARRCYYMRDHRIALDSLPHNSIHGKYMARISSRCAGRNDRRWSNGDKLPTDEAFSREFQMGRGCDKFSSKQSVLPLQGIQKDITKTAKVSLQRS